MSDPAEPESERRRHHRYQVREVRGRFPQHFEVEVLNMSLTGLAIECLRPLEIGKGYELTLQEGAERVKLEAEVEWCHLVRTESAGDDVVPVFQSGLDFRSSLDDTAQELLLFLQHHMVIDAERRIFGRFQLTLQGPAKVIERHDFVVQVISFSGMLIETDLLLEVGTSLDIELHAGEREFRVPGRVVNSRLLTEPKARVCRAGISFAGLDEETARALEEVAKDFLE